MTSNRILLYLAALAVATATGCSQPAPQPETPAAPAHDAAMDMHHLHGLMAHGLEMALEGASLKMVGQMNMAGTVDTTAVSHGDAMLTEGRKLIDTAISGPAMTAMHAANANDPLMTYTHELARNMTAVLDHLQAMPAPDNKKAQDMAMHHMHIAFVHAALMASQGATLKMTSAMKMADAVDQEAATHATAMFAHARGLYSETMNGDAMKAIHAGAAADAMTATHSMGESVNALIESLAKMP